MKKIIYMFFIFFINTIFVKADNMVNIHFFHLDDCKYCNSELELLDFIEDNYSNVKVYKYEISDKDNNELFNNITHLLNVNTSGVPFTIIGDTYYFGFDKRNSKKTFIATIEYYLKNDYNDIVNEYVNNNTITVSENNDNLLNYISNYGNHVLNLPFGLKVNTNDLEINFNILLISMLNFFSNYYLYICLFILLFINRNSKK